MSSVEVIASPAVGSAAITSSGSHAAHKLWLGRFAKLTSIATFLLILVGSLVTTTGSGLAVPDWPLSFGQFFPKMEGGVLYEHGHRMVAGAVGLLMTALAVWVWLIERRRTVRVLALVAWFAVVAQAILGGITVLHKLPIAVSVSHAGLAMAFFSLTVTLAMMNSSSWQKPGQTKRRSLMPTSLSKVALSTTALIYAQILVGALMRHMGAGLAIPDFPLSYGQLIPPLHAASVAVHFAHRVGAVVVGLIIVYQYIRIRRDASTDAQLKRWGGYLVALFGVQFLLGALTIWTMKSIVVTTAHVGVGALTLGLSLMVTLRAMRAPAAVKLETA